MKNFKNGFFGETVLEKEKTSEGKFIRKYRRNPITGKQMLITKDVEYKTNKSPRKVFKTKEVISPEGITTYSKAKENGKTVKEEKSFEPKKRVNIEPMKKGGSVKFKKK